MKWPAVIKRSLGKSWHVFFFFSEFPVVGGWISISTIDVHLESLIDFFQRYVWKTFSSASQVEREVMEMVSRCPQVVNVGNANCQLPWPTLTVVKGITKFPAPKRSVTKVLVVQQKSRVKNDSRTKNLVGWLDWLTDIKDLDLPPLKHPGCRMQSWQILKAFL